MTDNAPPPTARRLIINAIKRHFATAERGWQSRLARQLSVTRQFLNDVLRDDRQFPDSLIPALPDGLREEVIEIRAREYEGAAAMIRSYKRSRPDRERGEGNSVPQND